MKIIKNKGMCLKCGDVIESKSVHDFAWCSCEVVAVDGGQDYLKRVGDMDQFKDLSECVFDANDLEDMKKESPDKSRGEELPELSEVLQTGEGDPLGTPIRIYRAANGFICVDSDPDCGFSPVAVFERKEEEWEVGALIDLFWHLKDILPLEAEGKYSRDRLCMIIEVGEKYELREGERLVETKHLRVRGNLETNDFGERTLTKKEMEGA